MHYFRTEAIILRRTNYGEADRILSVLTPERGKISVIAKGVRRPKSKMAGGLELFSICDLTTVEGKGGLAIVTGAQIKQYFGEILHDYDRTQLAYDVIKQVNKATESVTSAEFYNLLKSSLISLGDLKINQNLIEVWFRVNLDSLLGEGLNLETDSNGEALVPDQNYNYDFAGRAFAKAEKGQYSGDHIKFLRLTLQYSPPALHRINGLNDILPAVHRIFS